MSSLSRVVLLLETEMRFHSSLYYAMSGYIPSRVEQAMLAQLIGENEVVAVSLYYAAAVGAYLNVLRNVRLVHGSILGLGLQIRRDPKHARASRDHVSGERKGAFVK